MNDSEPCRAVNETLGLDPLGLDGVTISSLDRFVKSAYRGAKSCSTYPVTRPSANVLPHSFLGRLDYRHL